MIAATETVLKANYKSFSMIGTLLQCLVCLKIFKYADACKHVKQTCDPVMGR